jgi:hypothetical protein
MKKTTSNVQHSTFNIQRSTFNVQRPTMKPMTPLKCSVLLAAAGLFSYATAAPPPIGAEYRVGGFVLGCQAWTFHTFTAFEAIEKTAAAGGKTIEFFPGQPLSPQEPKTYLDPKLSEDVIAKIKA